MSCRLISPGLVLALGLFAHPLKSEVVFTNPLNAEVVYDNSVVGSPSSHLLFTTFEYGDEVFLSKGDWVIRQLEVSYISDFITQGDETMTIRLYENDGEKVGRFSRAPGTELYDSGPLRIFGRQNPTDPPLGMKSIEIRGLSIVAPERVTWTVDFNGLTGVVGDRASLVTNEKPTVGFSFNDFWWNVAGQWQLWQYPKPLEGARPAANFVLKLTAVEQLKITSIRPDTNKNMRIGLNVVPDRRLLVEASSDLAHWSAISYSVTTGNSAEIIDTTAAYHKTRFYRARLVPLDELKFTFIRREPDQRMRLGLKVVPGLRLVLEATSDFKQWTKVSSFMTSTNFVEIIDEEAAQHNVRFYRARLEVAEPVNFAFIRREPNQQMRLGLNVVPGRRLVVEATSDFKQWSQISSFITSTNFIEIVDRDAARHSIRFYRARLETVEPLTFTSIRPDSNGQMRLELVVVPGRRLVVEATSDFKQWTQVSSFMTSTNFVEIVDKDAARHSIRFYRARLETVEPLTFTSIRPDSNRQTRLELVVVPNRRLIIEASSDFNEWSQVSSSVPSASVVQILDTNAAPHAIRLYRARQE